VSPQTCILRVTIGQRQELTRFKCLSTLWRRYTACTCLQCYLKSWRQIMSNLRCVIAHNLNSDRRKFSFNLFWHTIRIRDRSPLRLPTKIYVNRRSIVTEYTHKVAELNFCRVSSACNINRIRRNAKSAEELCSRTFSVCLDIKTGENLRNLDIIPFTVNCIAHLHTRSRLKGHVVWHKRKKIRIIDSQHEHGRIPITHLSIWHELLLSGPT
jgi:hypothetical protein